MRSFTTLLHGLLVITLIAACPAADGQAPGADAAVADEATSDLSRGACAKVCATGASLSCPNQPSDCVAICERSLFEPCLAPSRAILECMAQLPASEFVCDESGRSGKRADACKAEEQALLDCLPKSPP